jgi:hypothetical protein
MTKPLPLDRPHKKRGRALKLPPANAAQRIEGLVAKGLTKLGVARSLGTSADTFRRWLKEAPALQEAFDLGNDKVEFEMFNVLYRAAKKGNIVAAIYLTKARFGWREGETPPGSSPSVIINLPGAMPLEVYRAATIEHNAPAAIASPITAKLQRHG